MLVDYNLISYYSVEEVLPYAQYKSGEKAGENPIYQYSAPSKTYPVLALEEDILFYTERDSNGEREGHGIKRGFYQAVLSDDFATIILAESGRIVAKIPVVSIEQRKSVPPAKQKVKKQWRKPPEGKQYKPPQPLKNNKGVDNSDFIYLKASMHYDSDNNSYVLIYERGNTRAIGVIRK